MMNFGKGTRMSVDGAGRHGDQEQLTTKSHLALTWTIKSSKLGCLPACISRPQKWKKDG